MEIDIEKLKRKTPYPEPSEDFFAKMQQNVISQTIGQHQIVVGKEAKVVPLNFKWMAAAAVILIGGITAFFSLNNNPEISIAQQSPIVDSVYEIETPVQKPAANLLAENTTAKQNQRETPTPKYLNEDQTLVSKKAKTEVSNSGNISDTQDYAAVPKDKSDLDVEKVLAAFTPDQLKDIDRNSEQDVYLDLYN